MKNLRTDNKVRNFFGTPNPARNDMAEKVYRSKSGKSKWYKRRWVMVTGIFLAIIIAGGILFSLKTGLTISKITKGDISFFGNVYNMLPLVENKLKGEEDGRINIMLLGMRGEHVTGGGELADTIMILSIRPQENKAALVSVPRDLYVTVPGTSDRQKINSVYFYGEEKEDGGGIQNMETILEEVAGIPIHYGVVINFAGFEQLVDAIGGVTVSLSEPFSEPYQFNEPHPCDDNVFTQPTGQYEEQQILTSVKDGVKNYSKTIQVPLCTNPNKECGGNFTLPAGESLLDGEKALCYVRSRATSSDFDRARRQQEVLKLIKEKLVSVGTVTDFSKVNNLLNALGNNVKTDMELWEMKRFYELYGQMQDIQIKQRVFENSEEGLLYSPEESNGAGYILLPRGDNYERIHETVANIFNDQM